MRKFLTILDQTKECLNAMRFAAMRAKKVGAGVVIMAVIPPEQFNHWLGVQEKMREEAIERIKVHYEVYAKWMRDRVGIEPALVIREGEAVDEILKYVSEDKEICSLMLGADVSTKSPGVLITKLTKMAGQLPIVMAIVPGGLSKEALETIS